MFKDVTGFRNPPCSGCPPLLSSSDRRNIFSMTPATRRARPTDGALRAAKEIERNPTFVESTAEVIDRETGVRELVALLENMIAEAGDLIENRSPELAAQARAAVRHYGDGTPSHAE